MPEKTIKIVVDIQQGANGKRVLSILESDLDKITKKAKQSQLLKGKFKPVGFGITAKVTKSFSINRVG
jgi:hypothetical protein